MRVQIIAFLFIILPSLLFGQAPCNTDIRYAKLLENSHELVDKLYHQEEILQDQIRNSNHLRSIIVLPVVIHIAYHESKDSLSHYYIFEQIEQLNRDFNRLNDNLRNVPDIFKNDIADVGIKFCISYMNEDGNIELGIEQKSVNISYFGDQTDDLGNPRLKYSILDGFDSWDSHSFINIWVADFENMSGEASFPGTEIAELDGILIDYEHFGGKNRTLTHEMGHFLNLKHLWGMDENCNNDDMVSDTPSQESANYNCPSHPHISCGTADMFMNFMDFSDDDCSSFFTTGQMERMHQSLVLFRTELLDKAVCQQTNISFNLETDIYLTQNDEGIIVSFRHIPTEKINLRIYDVTGRFILKKEMVSNYTEIIDNTIMTTGIYFLHFSSNDNSITKSMFLVR